MQLSSPAQPLLVCPCAKTRTWSGNKSLRSVEMRSVVFFWDGVPEAAAAPRAGRSSGCLLTVHGRERVCLAVNIHWIAKEGEIINGSRRVSFLSRAGNVKKKTQTGRLCSMEGL